jgi:hypothetical protein
MVHRSLLLGLEGRDPVSNDLFVFISDRALSKFITGISSKSSLRVAWVAMAGTMVRETIDFWKLDGFWNGYPIPTFRIMLAVPHACQAKYT